MGTYDAFLRAKSIIDPPTGIAGELPLPDQMFAFQKDITRWGLRRGRAAVFAGTGLGKSLMEAAWADAVFRETGRSILHFGPLSVTEQLVEEAAKFGLAASLVRDQSGVRPGINVTNYQKMDRFDLPYFGGVILDESSILKSVDGSYRAALIDACSTIPFRLAATATPAPNDFMELGNHAEFLGVMSYTDMLATFFVHDGGDTRAWRLKGHAEEDFWRWMASWAVMLRQPSDLGYPDDGYNLPPIHYHQHTVAADYMAAQAEGLLFPLPVANLRDRISVKRDSIDARVRLAASLTPTDRPFAWWCHLNSESEALVRAIGGAVEVRGSDSEADKAAKLQAFKAGRIRVLVTKPKLAGFGLNWQHCADTGFVGMNDSFEETFQAIRRFWRFGQGQPVNVHFISDEREGPVVANYRRKEADADRMAAAMVRHMADLSATTVRGIVRDRPDYQPAVPIKLPEFLRGAA